MASADDGPVCDDITKPLEPSQDAGVDTACDAIKLNPTSVTYQRVSPTKKNIALLQNNRNYEFNEKELHDIINCDAVFAVPVEEKCNLNYISSSYLHQEMFLEDDNHEHFKMVLKVTNTPVSGRLQARSLLTQQKCITTQRCTSINKAGFNSTDDNTNSSDRNGFRLSCLVKNNLPSTNYLTYPVPSFFLATHRNRCGDVIFGPRHRTDKKVRTRVSFTPSDGLCSYVEKTEFDRKMPVKTTTKYQVVPTSDEVSEGHFLSHQTPFYESFGSANPSDSVVKSSELSPLRKAPKGNYFRANVLYELDKENKKTDLPKENVEDFEPNTLKHEKSKSDISLQDEKKCEFSICCWKFLDFALAYLWVGPLVTMYWCNTWHIPEHYFFPKDPVVSAWISGAAGYTIFFLASLFQDNLTSFTVRRRAFTRQIIMQLFSYVMCLACVNQWRCVWVLLDEYTGVSTMNAAITYACASVLLLLLRCHRGTVSPPAYIRMDFPVDKHFVVGKYFDAQSGPLVRVLDSLFSVVVVDSLSISVWRGLWEVMDMTLTPDSPHMSGVWTLVISYGLALALLVLQSTSQSVSVWFEGKHWLAHLVFDDVITVLYTVVGIMHWRGYWVLMDVYLPYRPVSLWVCHGASFILLAAGLCATAIPVLGCGRDGRLFNGEGVIFDNNYLTNLRNAWRSRTVVFHEHNYEQRNKRHSDIIAANI